MRTSQRRTFGPHQLHIASALEQNTIRCDLPVLQASSFIPRIFHTDEGSTEDEVKQRKGEADPMNL